jgi:capsid protein
MTRFAASFLAALVGICTPLATAPAAFAADLPGYVDNGDTGVCSEAWVLSKITHRFRYQVQHVPNLPDVAITDFRGIQQHRYLPASDNWPIGRRYCGATVALSNGLDRTIWYLIEEGQGYASVGDIVEFCVSGFDRWMVYNGRCRVLR